MFNLPLRFATFLGIVASPAPVCGKVFCQHCDGMAIGNDGERNVIDSVTYGSRDGRVFLGYILGHGFLVRHSRGKDRGKWIYFTDGGVLCELGHYTGIKDAQLFHVRNTQSMTREGALKEQRLRCDYEPMIRTVTRRS